jgi:hypothetical protein
MADALTWIDRLRIERAVWTLDQRLYDLPRKARIARRRELRENLRTAAQDVGVAAAVRNLRGGGGKGGRFGANPLAVLPWLPPGAARRGDAPTQCVRL